MAFSYARIILENCEFPVYQRGLKYAETGKIEIIPVGTAQCQAMAFGTVTYDIWLRFSRVGSSKYTCSCPYVTEHKIKLPCKHIIAAALLWDRGRDVPDPTETDAKSLYFQEPLISYADVDKVYTQPLSADLQIIRIAAEELSNWSRRHANLPLTPIVCKADTISAEAVKLAMSELKQWARKSGFDPYFCAGEMMAGFCELIRWVYSRIDRLPIDEQINILEQLTAYQEKLITGTIDDSDGLHEFSSAHLTHLAHKILMNPAMTAANQVRIDKLIVWASEIESLH